MSSFVRYILKHKHQETPYGDVARDILADPNVKRNWSHRRLSKYLTEVGATQRVFELIDMLHWEYKEIWLT